MTNEVRPSSSLLSARWMMTSVCVSTFAVASSRTRMRGLGDDGAGEADELALADREVLAALLQVRLVAVLEAHDEVVRADGARGLLDLFVGRVRAAVGDVLADGAGEEERLLEHDAHVPREAGVLISRMSWPSIAIAPSVTS